MEISGIDIVYEGIIGSVAQGLATSESDTDYAGIFILPIEQILSVRGVRQSDETATDSSPRGDDHTYHEVRKFFEMSVAGGPTAIDLIFSQRVRWNSVGLDIIKYAELYALNSTNIINSYGGFAKSAAHRCSTKWNHKDARHALRSVRFAKDVLSSAHPSIKVSDPDEYLSLTQERFLGIIWDEIDELYELGSTGLWVSPYPDTDTLSKFLMELRLSYKREG